MNLNPGVKAYKNYQTKEAAVVEYVRNTFSGISWTTDKRVLDGCSRRRPDILCHLGSHVIVIEVDESQHISYSCENKRMMEISRDLDHAPLIMIRFNPDSYTDANGTGE